MLPLGSSFFAAKTPPDPDLLHRWRFDDGLVDDVSKESLYSTVGTVGYDTGVFNNGVKITSTARDLRMTGGQYRTPAWIDGGGDFTFSCWTKALQSNDYYTPVYHYNAQDSTLLMNIYSQNKSEWFIRCTGGPQRVTTSYVNNVGEWNFWCGTWNDSSQQAVLYRGIGGAALTTHNGNPIYGARYLESTFIVRFEGFSGAGSGHITDDIRYHTRTFSESEAQVLYDEGLAALGS